MAARKRACRAPPAAFGRLPEAGPQDPPAAFGRHPAVIRILYVVTDLAVGGTPRSVESLVLGLDRTRFAPEVVTLLAPSPITGALAAAGIPCVALGLRGKLDAVRLWPLVARIRGGGHDIVHAWLFHANVLTRLLSPLTSAAIISSERGVDAGKPRFRVLIDRLTWRLADLVVTNAAAVRSTLAGRERIPPDRIRVVENGVDLDRFVPPADRPAGPPRLICVARLDPVKAHGDLLAAVARLRPRHPGIVLDLVGEGPARPALEASVRELGLSASVRFLGTREDVGALLSRAHVFVLASRSEGMPGSILEAMATALPVVATGGGGVVELVEDGRTGVLVPVADADALALAIDRLLSHPDEARAMGAAGRARVVERFTREAFVRRHEAIYEELATGRGDRGRRGGGGSSGSGGSRR
jgi:glycosyltransferase involved in cell wall biosynthesis